jgi:hypothetical protein
MITLYNSNIKQNISYLQFAAEIRRDLLPRHNLNRLSAVCDNTIWNELVIILFGFTKKNLGMECPPVIETVPSVNKQDVEYNISTQFEWGHISNSSRCGEYLDAHYCNGAPLQIRFKLNMLINIV